MQNLNLDIENKYFSTKYLPETEDYENIYNFIYRKIDLKKLGIHLNEFKNFIIIVREQYNDLYYHGFRKALLSSIFLIELLGQIQTYYNFTEIEKLIMIIYCMCHNVKHPGIRIEFMKKCNPDFFCRFNNYEEMHYSYTEDILIKSKLLINFSNFELNEIKRGIKTIFDNQDFLKINKIMEKDYYPKNLEKAILCKIATCSYCFKDFNLHYLWVLYREDENKTEFDILFKKQKQQKEIELGEIENLKNNIIPLFKKFNKKVLFRCSKFERILNDNYELWISKKF